MAPRFVGATKSDFVAFGFFVTFVLFVTFVVDIDSN